MSRFKGQIDRGSAIALFPNWTTLPNSPVTDIQADHRIETEIDPNGVGRVRMRPGYSGATLSDIRYTYGSVR